METFLDPSSTSLKICGVTRPGDAERLVELGVHALGINFWPHSKRYLAPESAKPLLQECAGSIVRVGVFVNADPCLPRELFDSGYIDILQLHGDESPAYCSPFVEAGIPFIKAVGVQNKQSLENISDYGANAILLDTPAPGIYGGTGETFDWTHAETFIKTHPHLPVLLAGGITPENAVDAISRVQPAALDIASGAETSPGIKDIQKVKKLLACIRNADH